MSASTQNQALAPLFLYCNVLDGNVPWLDELVRARRPARLPIMLSCDEVGVVIRELEGVHRLMATLLYGAGLRLLECARLRVKDVDFGRSQITVRRGKGDRDRLTVLPATAQAPLARHLVRVRHLRANGHSAARLVPSFASRDGTRAPVLATHRRWRGRPLARPRRGPQRRGSFELLCGTTLAPLGLGPALVGIAFAHRTFNQPSAFMLWGSVLCLRPAPRDTERPGACGSEI